LNVACSHLIKEWDHRKNTLLPENLSVGSRKEAWWLCKKSHSWLAKIYRKTKCPYCEKRLVCKDNCLSTTHPELASEWHPDKNYQLTPQNFTMRSGKKIWWTCQNESVHEWEMAINKRSRGSGCPHCLSKKNSLSSIEPLIAKEFHPNNNGSLTPHDFTYCSAKKVWWQCLRDRSHKWEATISNRTTNRSGCPYCANKKADKTNCLAKTHPKLANEWHPSKNGSLTPTNVVAGSDKNVWWLCEKNNSHEWEDMISHRKRGAKCN